MKGYNWDEIRQAAINGEDDIGRTGGVFNINHLPNIDMVDENEPFEIEHGGNAFMMIRRDCFETLKAPILPYILMEEDLFLMV